MLKPKTYKVLEQAVEDGAAYAWRSRIYKYTDEPSDDAAIETIVNCVMNEISEWFDFEDESSTL
jgi:hypothetical protein